MPEDTSNQQFTIQPHPAKTNDPNDLVRDAAGEANAFNTPGLSIPTAATTAALDKPKSREELHAESKKLNE